MKVISRSKAIKSGLTEIPVNESVVCSQCGRESLDLEVDDLGNEYWVLPEDPGISQLPEGWFIVQFDFQDFERGDIVCDQCQLRDWIL